MKISRLILITVSATICLAIVLGTHTVVNAGQRFVIEFDVDRPGHDYESFAVSSMEDCLQACNEDFSCSSFTYVGRGYQPSEFNNERPICWLKDRVPDSRRGTGMVSGIKR